VSISTIGERDEDVLEGLRNELERIIAQQWDLKSTRPKILFATAHDLRNATTFTELACEMALARKMDVMMVYAGMNATDTIPFFLRANKFDESNCPFVWFDGRHEYPSLYKQTNAVEDVISDNVVYVNPSVVMYLDDEPEWFLQALERATIWRTPPISMVQLKRGALPNLRWISSLSPSTLMGNNIKIMLM
jgi:hypothetical protein